ncbi:MAG TPA: hypothetical protein VGN73_11855 [Gemmatimonadaceae bacterium]|jgi:hypothetical protein|nr:hypothetical protein [Gemmatimonadaceae bacterium]
MAVAKFDPGGGAIKVAVSCDPNRNGSYTIKLWEANANQVIKKYPGNFLNTADDEYTLDPPNSRHDGRLLEGMIVVAVPPGVGPSEVKMVVSQEGTELAEDKRSVVPGSPGELVDLFIELEPR